MKYVSYNNEMKLEISNKMKFGTLTNRYKLNNKLLNNQCIKEEITKMIRKYIEMNKNVNRTYKSYGMQQRHCL